MKRQSYCIVLLWMIMFLGSCKKENKEQELKIRYEITTTQNMITTHNLLGKLDAYLDYIKDREGNEQSDEKLSGKNWIKEITITNPAQSMIIGFGGKIYLGASSGSTTAKIYVNGKLEAEVLQQATIMPTNNLSLVIVGAQYNYTK